MSYEKNENQQDKTIKESVTYGEYVVNKLTDGGYNVVKGGTLCNNTKDALRDIALSIQFPIDNGWTTRQLGAKIVKALKDGVPQVIDNIVTAKQQGANKSRIIVELHYKEHEYMGLDQDYNMVVDTSFAFYDYPQSISIIVNGIELDDNAVDEVWDRLETPSNYKPFDMGKKWDNEDIERFGYYSNDAYKVWDFEIENFDIEKLCFYEEPYDAIFTQGDYNEEVCLIKLYYDNNEIEEDYDSYDCEAGNFCEQWSLYEDEEDDQPYEEETSSTTIESFLKTKYDEVMAEDNIYYLKLNEKWGFANKDGEVIIPPRYDWMGNYTEDGIEIFGFSGKMGYVSIIQGVEIVEAKYDSGSDFVGGYAKVKFNEKWGVIDNSGKEVIPLIYDSLTLNVENSRVMVKFDGDEFEIDMNGNRI